MGKNWYRIVRDYIFQYDIVQNLALNSKPAAKLLLNFIVIIFVVAGDRGKFYELRKQLAYKRN